MPSVSRKVARNCREFVKSFILQDDFVPCASFTTISQTCETVSALAEIATFRSVLHEFFAKPSGATEQVNFSSLFPAGECYHITYSNKTLIGAQSCSSVVSSIDSKDQKYSIVRCRRAITSVIRLSSTMVFDSKAVAYGKALKRLHSN